MSASAVPTNPAAMSRDLMRSVPTMRLGGMPIAVLDMQQTADLMIAAAQTHQRPNLPLFMTSANGEVLSRHASNPDFARFFRSPISSTRMASQWWSCPVWSGRSACPSASQRPIFSIASQAAPWRTT